MSKREVAKQDKQELAQLSDQKNFFEIYGEQVSTTNIVGKLLKFNKGDWLAGQDEEDVPAGTKLVANMDNLLVGWIKWVDSKPAIQDMGLLSEGFKPKRREELGDLDSSEWGERQSDPWQLSHYLLMKVPGKKASDDNLYTLAVGSKGGIRAVGELCKIYGHDMRQHAGEFPIVQLGSRTYDHPEYGRIHAPTLAIVGWEKKATFDGMKKPA